MCSVVCKGVTSEVMKYLFRAANVWWGVRSILLFPRVDTCPETMYMYVYGTCMFLCLL